MSADVASRRLRAMFTPAANPRFGLGRIVGPAPLRDRVELPELELSTTVTGTWPASGCKCGPELRMAVGDNDRVDGLTLPGTSSGRRRANSPQAIPTSSQPRTGVPRTQ